MLIVLLNDDDDNEGERDGEMNHLANMYACIFFLCVRVIVETHRRGFAIIKAYIVKCAGHWSKLL